MRFTALQMVSIAAMVGIAAGCGGSDSAGSLVDAEVEVISHEDRGSCVGNFRPIDLPHVTRGRTSPATQVDGMGSGTTVADLDRDGDLDIVLGNISGETSIFWNTGGLTFEQSALSSGRFRQLTAVDIDGDQWPDITATTGVGPPVLFRSDTAADGDRPTFTREELPNVRGIAFSAAWGDLGGDGDLDLVTGAYNAELTSLRNPRAIAGEGVGVNLYTADGGTYDPEVLAENSQALVSQIVDIDRDGRADVLIGNDLSTPDFLWTSGSEGLIPQEPFATTTLSTMSMDQGDIDNDGEPELFATDMRPMTDDPQTRDAWAPVADDIEAAMVDEVQIPENVLQRLEGGRFANSASDLGVRATGWSWSGLFGDLDNDGALDLYVVNGMEAKGLFDHLPDSTLVEANQAFRNSSGAFESAPQWGLADTAGGRGMSLADLDHDGDLDIVVNNLGAPSRIWENRVCAGPSITADLVWEGTTNTAALNSEVVATSPDGNRRLRTISGSRGYLSGGPASVHFGLGLGATSVDVEVTWPDGRLSRIPDVAPGSRLIITRRAAEIG